MVALIDKIFRPSQAEAIRKLWEDKDSKALLKREIAKQLLKDESVLVDLPLSQIMFLMSLSSFASSENECYDVAGVIYWGISQDDIFPLITEHTGKELAYRCLISLSLFKSCMEEKTKRRGAPDIKYYRLVGINSFNVLGKTDIGSHFCQWESFIGEMFI